MRRWLSILVSFAIASPACAIVRRDDVSDSAYITASNAYPQTVWLNCAGAGCTGTLIAPDWILTAAHCVDDLTSSDFRLISAGNGNAFWANSFTPIGSDVEVYPEWDGDTGHGNDLALIKLNGPVAILPIRRHSGTLPSLINAQIQQVGYGFSGTGLTGSGPEINPIQDDDMKRAGTNVVDARGGSLGTDSVNSILTDFDSPTSNSNLLGSPTATALEASPSGGDSGGSWYSGGALIGVHSKGRPLPSGERDDFYGTFDVATAVSPFNDWINQTMGGVNWNTTSTTDFNTANAWGDGRVPTSNQDVQFSLPSGIGNPTRIIVSSITSVRNLKVEFGTHEFQMTDSSSLTANGPLSIDSNGSMKLLIGTLVANRRLIVGESTNQTSEFQMLNVSHVVLNDVDGGSSGNSLYVGQRGTGIFTQAGDAELTVQSNAIVGVLANSIGTYNLLGGTATFNNRLTVGGSGKGTFSHSGSADVIVNDSLFLGTNTGSDGKYDKTGVGSLTVHETIYTGYGDIGVFEQSAGVTSASEISIGTLAHGNGTLSIKGGTLSVGRISFGTGTGKFNFTGGTLRVDTFNGNLTNGGGKLSPGNSAGHTQINGTYSQAGTNAALEIEIGGLAPSTGLAVGDYDKVDVTGALTLGGNLLVSLLTGFTPNANDVFTVFDGVVSQFGCAHANSN